MMSSDVANQDPPPFCQVFGGYVALLAVERYMRDLKVTQIHEGNQPGTADGYLGNPQIVKGVS